MKRDRVRHRCGVWIGCSRCFLLFILYFSDHPNYSELCSEAHTRLGARGYSRRMVYEQITRLCYYQALSSLFISRSFLQIYRYIRITLLYIHQTTLTRGATGSLLVMAEVLFDCCLRLRATKRIAENRVELVQLERRVFKAFLLLLLLLFFY